MTLAPPSDAALPQPDPLAAGGGPRRGRRPAAELIALRARIETLMLAGLRSPAIHRALAGPDNPRPIVISERAVRSHMRAIERSWRERASDATLEADRASEVARIEEVMRIALTRSTLNAGSTIGVGYLNVYLKAQERYARLRGIDAPVRNELTGRDGGPLALVVLADHPAEHYSPAEEARRFRQLATDCDAEAADADDEPRPIGTPAPGSAPS